MRLKVPDDNICRNKLLYSALCCESVCNTRRSSLNSFSNSRWSILLLQRLTLSNSNVIVYQPIPSWRESCSGLLCFTALYVRHRRGICGLNGSASIQSSNFVTKGFLLVPACQGSEGRQQHVTGGVCNLTRFGLVRYGLWVFTRARHTLAKGPF